MIRSFYNQLNERILESERKISFYCIINQYNDNIFYCLQRFQIRAAIL